MGEVGFDRFLEQLGLGGRERLGSCAEAPALVQGQFLGEFVDLGLPEEQFPVLAFHSRDQSPREFAQRLGIEGVQGGGIPHGLRMPVLPPSHQSGKSPWRDPTV